MRLLFEMDLHDYADCTHDFVRNSARSIIIRDGKIAMIHSLKYDYYKFPGDIEGEESPIAAMIRETCEEAGLVIKPETVREYGYVHRAQRSDSDPSECFVQDIFIICAMRRTKPFRNAWMHTKPMRAIRWNSSSLLLPFKRTVACRAV